MDGLFYGKSYWNGWFGGTPILGNLHMTWMTITHIYNFDHGAHVTLVKQEMFLKSMALKISVMQLGISSSRNHHKSSS